jgi:hypothetical protein
MGQPGGVYNIRRRNAGNYKTGGTTTWKKTTHLRRMDSENTLTPTKNDNLGETLS